MLPNLNPPPSSLPIPSLWVVPVHQPQASSIVHRTGLATRFIHDIIHVSMSFYQIIPPYPSPTESIRLFYTSVSLLLYFKATILQLYFDFPGGSDGKVSVYNVGDLGSIPGSGRSTGEGNGNPLQYYCLENPMDRGAW